MTVLFTVVVVLISWAAFILSLYVTLKSKFKNYTAVAVWLLSMIFILSELYRYFGIN